MELTYITVDIVVTVIFTPFTLHLRSDELHVSSADLNAVQPHRVSWGLRLSLCIDCKNPYFSAAVVIVTIAVSINTCNPQLKIAQVHAQANGTNENHGCIKKVNYIINLQRQYLL